MAPQALNYRHLQYFLAVARAGSIARAADRLGLSAQAISTQLGQLERQLGQALFAPAGRGLALTEAGRTALVYAEQIFDLGGQLQQALVRPGGGRPRLAVGITDGVPKTLAFELLSPFLAPPLAVRLSCLEGGRDALLGELALGHLDLVVADSSAPEQAHVPFHSHLLGDSPIDLFAVPELAAGLAEPFPAGLEGLALLLPMTGTPLREAIDRWLAERGLRPEVVGEFSDSALLKTFARAGLGAFPAPARLADSLARQFGACRLGRLEGVHERWYALTTPRRLPHPAVAALVAGGLPEVPAD